MCSESLLSSLARMFPELTMEVVQSFFEDGCKANRGHGPGAALETHRSCITSGMEP